LIDHDTYLHTCIDDIQYEPNVQILSGTPTKLVMMESPTNPMQRICDISALATVAHAFSAILSVDNTMMSPILQNPLVLGADICMHSATKFICGHADTMAGIVIAKYDTSG
jgi:cystathionine beta-lyase